MDNDHLGQPKPRAGTESLALDTDLGWAIRMVSTAIRRVATGSVADLPGGARGYLVLVHRPAAVSHPPSSPWPKKSVSIAP
ncbi:hypothetical protein [Streptomyces sp. Je 1-332]|uniref:hypothetical protein n=1 Tax=Streptomyces sp. Je 1-332 TaxID=3231270 RepID=UPI0034574530